MGRRTLRVGPTGPHQTIAKALAEAVAGDAVVLGPGVYSRASGEQFPLYVPPGVSLRGSGPAETTIDGGGEFEWSWRPFRTDQSLLVLRDGSSLSGVTVEKSGGCGVAVSRGRCEVSDAVIRNNGLHGLLIAGVDECTVRRCTFANNGTTGVSVPTYRPQPARPGESIFVICAQGRENRILITDNAIDGSTDQESLTVVSDSDDDDATGRIQIIDNHFSVARVCVLLCASFGGSRHRLAVDFANNDVRGAAVGLIACAAYPVVHREAVGNVLTLRLSDNQFRDCGGGVLVAGAFAPARDNVVDVDVHDAHFVNVDTAVRVIGAVGSTSAVVKGNRARARLHGLTVSGAARRTIVVDGAAMEVPSGVLSIDNEAEVVVGDNSLGTTGRALLRDGVEGNHARVADGVLEAERAVGVGMLWE
jgi:hypothetical protein